MFLLILLAGLLAAGVAYQKLGILLDARRHRAPGRIFDVGCARLHLFEQGAGQPAVVLESGIAGSSLSWALVQPKIAEFTRVCSYDRAGLGWSAACSQPRTLDRMTSELNSLLHLARIPKPYILVGHSFGGLLVRAYAHRYPDDVAALLFVDPVSSEFWSNCPSAEQRRLMRGVQLSRRGAHLARFGIVRLMLTLLVSGRRIFPKWIARATATGEGTKLMERMTGEIRRLPPEVWPMISSHWSTPKCFEAMALYLEALPASARAAQAMRIPEQIPFIVLSASNATETELAERDAWAQRSAKARHIRLEQSGHWIQLEHPGRVIQAIQELIASL